MESQLPGTLPKRLKEIWNGAHALSVKSVVKFLVEAREDTQSRPQSFGPVFCSLRSFIGICFEDEQDEEKQIN